jgi:tetratricopeptide (TPR) repeat protein
MAGMEQEQVERLLGELPGKETAWLQAQPPEILHERNSQSYRFRHGLYQEFVIQQISPADRAALHSKAGAVLAALYDPTPGEQAIRIAYHYKRAGLVEKTVPYFLQAAQYASGLSAYEQSIALLTHALELNAARPPSPRRDADELQLLNALSGQLVGGIGWGSEERRRVTRRAYDLCQHTGEAAASQFLLTLFSLADMARARGQHDESMTLGQQMLQLAQTHGEREYLSLSHWSLGETFFYQGELDEARRHLEAAVDLHTPGKESGLGAITGTDTSVVCLCWLSWVYAMEGEPDEARAAAAEAVAIADRLDHPFNQVFALTFGRCGLHALQGDWQAVLDAMDELMPLVQQDDLAPMMPWALVFQGWAQTLSGEAGQGIDRIRSGMDAWREAGAVSGLTCMGYYLAQACRQANRTGEANAAADETLALVEETGERLFEPHLSRLKGDLAR